MIYNVITSILEGGRTVRIGSRTDGMTEARTHRSTYRGGAHLKSKLWMAIEGVQLAAYHIKFINPTPWSFGWLPER